MVKLILIQQMEQRIIEKRPEVMKIISANKTAPVKRKGSTGLRLNYINLRILPFAKVKIENFNVQILKKKLKQTEKTESNFKLFSLSFTIYSWIPHKHQAQMT